LTITHPNNVQALEGKATSLMQLDKLQDARIIFEKALEISPDSHYSWCVLGFLYSELNEPELAIKALNNALESDAECKAASDNLIEIYIKDFVEKSINCDLAVALGTLEKLLEVSKKISNKNTFNDFIVTAFRDLLENNNIPLIKATLEEILKTQDEALIKLLNPYDKLIKFKETNDFEVIERLHKEERTIVEEMLEMMKKSK